MTKADIVAAMHRQSGLSIKESKQIVEAVFERIKEQLAQGQPVKISKFGNFTVREKRARAGRNPKTGEPATIVARCVLTFRPSQILRDRIR